MTRRIVCLVAALLAAADSTPCYADWYVMPFIALDFAGDTNVVDLEDAAPEKHFSFGGTVTLLGDGVLGFEGDFGYAPGFFERGIDPPLVTSSSVTTLVANVVVAVPRRWTGYSLRPYVSGGFGAMRVSIEDVLNLFRVTTTLPALNVGGGALGAIGDRFGVRWDIRYLRGARGADESGVSFGSTKLSFWRASMALLIRY